MNNILISTPQVIALCAGGFIFHSIVLIGIFKDEMENKASRIQRPKEEWLFTNWEIKLYDCITKKEPERALISLGVNVEEYKKNYYIVYRKEPDLKSVAANKYVGVGIMLFGVLMLAISQMSGIILTLILFALGYIRYIGDVNSIKTKAIAKKNRIAQELPRFLDLLQTALYIDIPISEAIVTTSKHLNNTLIANELRSSLAEMRMGSVSWQTALSSLAIMYDVDSLSDFVQYIITGYEKGLNIYDVVSRQADDTRKTTLINAEANANKLSSSIILPIGIFKLFPLIALIAYPIVSQLLNGTNIF